jgi:HlyD family secretion protein
MRRWLRRIGIVAILLALLLALRYTLLRPDPVPVTVFVVARGRVEETVTNSKAGTVRTRHRAKLSPEIGGRVVEVPVKKGERVEAGQVLIRLDETQYKSQVELAGKAFEAARGVEKESCLSADLAARDLARVESLARERLVSDQALDQARSQSDVTRTACESARARASQASSQREVARAELAKTVLRSPFAGVVAELTTEKGEWITPSPPGILMPSVIDLIDPDAIYVSAPLDEVELGKMSVGQQARITLDSFPGKSFPGRITRIAPYVMDIAEQSRTFEVEAVFDDEAFARGLPPGASADIEAILSSRENAIRIPSYAVLEGKRVLVVQAVCEGGASLLSSLKDLASAASGECLAAKEVQVGLKNWEFAEIVHGLAEGDRVVVSLDRAEVKEGARVRQTATAEK